MAIEVHTTYEYTVNMCNACSVYAVQKFDVAYIPNAGIHSVHALS